MENKNVYKTSKELQKYIVDDPDEQYQYTGIHTGVGGSHVLLIGATGTGKTNSLLNFLVLTSKPSDGTFRHIFFVHKKHEPIISLLKEQLDPSQISFYNSVLEMPLVSKFPDVKNNKNERAPKFLVVFDDSVTDKDKKSRKIISDYFMYGRSKNITIFFLTQSFYETDVFYRRNSGYALIHSIKGQRDLRNILKDCGDVGDIDIDKLQRMYEYSTTKRSDDEIPFFKIDLNHVPIHRKFSRNWLDYLDPSQF